MQSERVVPDSCTESHLVTSGLLRRVSRLGCSVMVAGVSLGYAAVRRTSEKLTARPWPAASAHELENGVPS